MVVLRTIVERLARGDLDAAGVDLLHNMSICLDAAQIWHGRYVVALQERIAASQGAQEAHCRRLLDNLIDVPEHPPTSYRQAVQALWFAYAFQRLCGNWSGIGCIDRMLNPYLERDLREGRITLDEAREILAHFWINAMMGALVASLGKPWSKAHPLLSKKQACDIIC